MSSTATFYSFGPFFDAGAIVVSPRIYHYSAGTSTLLNAWTDRAKSTTAAQPLVGDANGVASAHFDGLYKIVVKTSGGSTLFTWDNFNLTEADHNILEHTDSVFRVTGSADATKKVAFEVDGLTTGTTRTYTTPDKNGTLAMVADLGLINLLPNTNWQLMSTNTQLTKMNVEGTGTELGVTFTSFTASSNTPTFLTTNTQRLVVGDRVTISGLGNLSVSGMVVTAVVVNTSFTLKLPLGLLSPATNTGNAVPIGNGDIVGNTTGASGVGWNKTVALISWVDDFVANRVTGARRVMGFRKTAASTQIHYWNASTRSGTDMAHFAGTTVTFGAWVRHKVKGGAGTFKLTLNDGVSTTNSTSGTGSGSFEFLSVTKTLSASTTDVIATLSLDGASGDVYYLGLPTLVYGSTLDSNQLGPPLNEVLFAGHWNPPILTPLAMTFPATAYPGTGGLLFGFSGEDMEAMSYGVMHHTVKAARCKIEFTTATAGRMLLTGSTLDGQLAFGPQQVTQVASVMNVCWGILPFDENGDFAIFTAAASTVIANATFDFDVVYL